MIDLFGPTVGASGVTIRPTETRTFNETDTFFKDCTSADLDDGTEYGAALFNQWLANIRSIARSNGQTETGVDIVTQDNADDALLLKAIQHLIRRGLPSYGVDSGQADAMFVALTPPMTEYKVGAAPIRITKGNAANATTTPTLDLGPGPKTVVGRDGNGLDLGELPANGDFWVRYDGTNLRLCNPAIAATVAEAEAGALLHKFISPQTLLKRRTPYFVMTQTGTFSLPSGANTIIPITVDGGHYFADGSSSIGTGNRFTCGASDAGLWLFIGTFGLTLGVSAQINCAIAKNGGTPTPYQAITAAATVNTHMTYAIRMAAGDYAQLSGFQNSGSSQTQSEGQLVGLRLSA
jgi:hypothetical protein